MDTRPAGRSALLVLSLAVLLLDPQRRAFPGEDQWPTFAFGFDGPVEVQGSPGEVKTFDIFPTLTTTDNSSPDGAQGWSFVLWIEGKCVISNTTLKGIVVSTIYDEDVDGDPGTPEVIHHDPFFHDLGISFTSIINRCGSPEMVGAISAVVMKSQEKMVLQPNGTQRIAMLRIQAVVPSECTPLIFRFMNGLPYCGGSQPVNNVVTFGGGSVAPQVGSATILLCPFGFLRGDANSDGMVDISDAIACLGFLYLGGRVPGCMKAADANDDGQVDISDPVFALLDLFSLQGGTLIPPPGPLRCGTDPTPDALFCLEAPRCP
jgi:hypothetical protein